MTTATKRDSDAKDVFRRFTDTLVELLEHPETPTEVHDALLDAVAGINNATQAASAPKDFDRLVLERVFGLNGRETPAGASPRPAADEDLWHHYQWLAEAMAALIEDDRTPAWLHNSLIESSGEIDNRASHASARGREAVFIKQMFASLCEMTDEAEEQKGGAGDESES